MSIYLRLYEKLFPRVLKKLIEPVAGRINEFVLSAVNKTNSDGLVLDAGAGESRHKGLVKNRKYIAIDAAWGDEEWNYSNLDVIGDLVRLPFSMDVFDCILCIQVLEHVNEPQKVLNELFRILKQGGIICLTAPQGAGVHQPPNDYFRYTNYGLTYLFEKAGFEIMELKPICGYFGYLANRFTVLPKTLFWQIENKWLRVILFPFEMVSYLIFVVLFPIILNTFDFLDRKQNYTLNYMALAKKP